MGQSMATTTAILLNNKATFDLTTEKKEKVVYFSLSMRVKNYFNIVCKSWNEGFL